MTRQQRHAQRGEVSGIDLHASDEPASRDGAAGNRAGGSAAPRKRRDDADIGNLARRPERAVELVEDSFA